MSDFINARAGDVAAYDADCDAGSGPQSQCAACGELTQDAEVAMGIDGDPRCAECMQRIEDAYDLEESRQCDEALDARRGL